MPSYVIVGASRGLGYQFLKTISQQDPSNIVIGTARSPSETQKKVAADGLKNVHIVHGDMDSSASLTAAAEKTAELTGGVVDYLIVNGAYFALPSAFFDVDDFVGKEDLFLQELQQSMNTNVAGTLFAFNAFLPLVLKSSIKRVAAIGTGAADQRFIIESEQTNSILYALSKAALHTLVAKFAVKYQQEGVLFVSISPGWVNTLDDLPKEIVEKVTKPLFRYDPALKGPQTTAESVDACLKVLDGLKKEQSGEFLSHHGNKVWLVSK